ncbi:carbohydrate sulfotransferase 15-like [Mytilus californianus]|uniref:carbohydrate sulfotransferase 15-like n=1 Tax=Mytilus californianus TaxID=6549 RepID=UPI0022476A89|nr:carbohydrate sulfotransferase 15-like [Mytilus californianus]
MDFWQAFDWRNIPQNNPQSIAPKYITPDLIKHINPNIKIILMIRDPVERLYSHYIHDKRFIIRELDADRNIPDDLYIRRISDKKVDPETFDEYVKSSIDLYIKCIREYGIRGCLYGMRIFYDKRLPLVAGLYNEFLKDWLRVFKKEQFLIIKFEDYIKDTGGVMAKVFEFLDVGMY